MDIEDEFFKDVVVPGEQVSVEVPVEGGTAKAPEHGNMLPTRGSKPVVVENGPLVGPIHGADVTPAIEQAVAPTIGTIPSRGRGIRGGRGGRGGSSAGRSVGLFKAGSVWFTL